MAAAFLRAVIYYGQKNIQRDIIMKILVDADACPVKLVIEKVAAEFSIPVIMLTDSSHELHSQYSKIVTVGKGKDAVDLALINLTVAGDIVVTQDYGLAALALSKKAFALNQNGRYYTDENINGLLLERHISAKARRAGKRGGYIAKRNKEQDLAFEEKLRALIQKVMSSMDN